MAVTGFATETHAWNERKKRRPSRQIRDRTDARLRESASAESLVANPVLLTGGGLVVNPWLRTIQPIHLDEDRVPLATARYAGEGFDDARLDTLFLKMPFS